MTPQEIADRDRADLSAIMSTTCGRRFIDRVLSMAGVYSACFNTDPLRMAEAEGRRNVGLRLLAELDADHPAELIQMMRQRLDERVSMEKASKEATEAQANEGEP